MDRTIVERQAYCDTDDRSNPVDARERSPSINEHGYRESYTGDHGQEQTGFRPLGWKVLLVQMLLVEVGTEPKERCHTTYKSELHFRRRPN